MQEAFEICPCPSPHLWKTILKQRDNGVGVSCLFALLERIQGLKWMKRIIQVNVVKLLEYHTGISS